MTKTKFSMTKTKSSKKSYTYSHGAIGFCTETQQGFQWIQQFFLKLDVNYASRKRSTVIVSTIDFVVIVIPLMATEPFGSSGLPIILLT